MSRQVPLGTRSKASKAAPASENLFCSRVYPGKMVLEKF